MNEEKKENETVVMIKFLIGTGLFIVFALIVSYIAINGFLTFYEWNIFRDIFR